MCSRCQILEYIYAYQMIREKRKKINVKFRKWHRSDKSSLYQRGYYSRKIFPVVASPLSSDYKRLDCVLSLRLPAAFARNITRKSWHFPYSAAAAAELYSPVR